MNRIDNATSAGFDPGRPDRSPAPTLKSGGASRGDARPASEPSQPPAKTETQRATAEILDVIADSVMQRQVRNINVLTASVTKFMLTSLEPAMQIAQEIRARSADEPDQAMDAASDASHSETLAVLGE